MSQSATPNVSDLFQDAHDAGDLTAGSLQVLQNIGDHFQAALGTPAMDVTASEIMLFGLQVDNSGSMAPMAHETIMGQNLCLDALGGSKQASSIMVHTRYLDSILTPYCLLVDADRLSNSNYQATMGRTPLYDASLELLAATVAKTQEFASNGVPVRSVNVIITDGGDNASRHSADDVKKVVEDMLRAENHIIAGMGIDDGYTDFSAIFKGMGIPDTWILTPGKDPSSLRRAFQVVSQSAVRASQTTNFSQTNMGGFGGFQ